MVRARPVPVVVLVFVGLAVAALAAYATSLANAPVWDDVPVVVANPHLGSLSGLGRLWTSDLWSASAQGEPSSFYRPMTMLSFWVNVAVFGRSAVWLRLGNVLIHAVNGMLLALFARKAAGIEWRAAGLAALLFVVAPIASEPVLWISGRFDLLVVTFALAALLASRVKGPLGLAVCLASVAAGLLSKESFTGWLPLLLVDDAFVRRASWRSLVAKYAAVAALAAGYLALRAAIGIPSLGTLASTGARAFVESFLFLVGAFLRELVWPSRLDPFRPYERLPLADLAVIAAALASLFGAALVGLRRHRESAAARLTVFGIAWFTFATLPSAVVGPTLAMVGDRYAYLPLVGLFVAAAAVLAGLDARGRRAGLAASGFAALVAIAWGALTSRHSRDWRDDATLAASSLASDPENPYALYWLGSDAAQRGRFEEADGLLGRSLARNEGAWRTWNALCYVRLNQDRFADAERACKETTRLNDRNPRAWVNLASVYVRTHRWPEALDAAEHATTLKPRYPEAHYLAGVAAISTGLDSLATSHVAAGLVVEPTNPKLRDLERELVRRKNAAPLP